MKKILFSMLSLLVAMTIFAQSESTRTMRIVYNGEVVFSRDVNLIDSITFMKETIDEITPNANDTLLNNFAIGDYGLFNIGDPIAGTDTIIELSVGEIPCQLYKGTFYVWDDNLVYADWFFSGAGYMFTAEVPVYVVTEGEYMGAWIDFGGVMVDTLPENTAVEYTAQHGQLVDEQMYGDGWKALLAAKTQEDSIAAQELIYGAQTGTQLFYIDWDNMSHDFNCANVKHAEIIENDSLGLLFDLKLEWYDWVNENRLYGLAVEEVITEAGDTTLAIVEPYDMRYINKEYSNMPIVDENASSNAPAMMPKKNHSIISNKTIFNKPIKLIPKIDK